MSQSINTPSLGTKAAFSYQYNLGGEGASDQFVSIPIAHFDYEAKTNIQPACSLTSFPGCEYIVSNYQGGIKIIGAYDLYTANLQRIWGAKFAVIEPTIWLSGSRRAYAPRGLVTSSKILGAFDDFTVYSISIVANWTIAGTI